MSPRKPRPFARIPYRKHGYGTAAAARLLSERGLPMTPWTLRRLSDAGLVASHRSEGGVRRFMAADLERFLRSNIDKRPPAN